MIEMSRIVEDPDQPRKALDAESLQGLADSIRQHGLLQPITVTSLPNVNMYRIVTGERRWRACQMLDSTEIPCIIREVDQEDILTQQLIENLQREDLQPLEKAQAISSIKTRINATNREVGARLGLSERAIGYTLELLTLPEAISKQVISSPNRPSAGQITEKHARFLKQLQDSPELQQEVADKIKSDQLNSDATGKLVKALRQQPDRREEIMASSTDHFEDFFRDLPPVSNDGPPFEAPGLPSTWAATLRDYIPTLEAIRPMDLPKGDVEEILASLIQLKDATDALIRECKLELE